MEDRIKLLPEKIANQIAAGEVVNRPASVVKEMMENAIDAGATEVIVNYRRGGEDLIQIVDNGVGMTPNDARMAFERHATSKISEAEDIYALHSFGFRGEALASICAVAQVELRSRHRDANIGTTTTINGGEFVDQQPTMCEQGAQFFVRNLFYNVPARRKFMERESSKPKSIKDEFQRVALCNPAIAFELYGDDAPIYKLFPATQAERIVDVIGRNIRKNLLEVGAKTIIVNVSGYIGQPKSATKSSSNQFLFVNGRYFKSPYLHKAICRAYDKLIADQHTPAYFIFLEVDPSRVDVNIHPQKTEVKFADEESIWQIVNASVRETLAKTGAVPMMEFNAEDNIEIPVMRRGVNYAEPRSASNTSYNPFDPDFTPAVDPSRFEEGGAKYAEGEVEEEYDEIMSDLIPDLAELEDVVPTTTPQKGPLIDEIDLNEWSNIEIEDIESAPKQRELIEPQNIKSENKTIIIAENQDISLTGGRYAWCQIGGEMAVIDLKRAKERLLYDYYISTYKGGEAVSQQTLFPNEMQLTKEEYSLMRDNTDEFSKVGFEIDYCADEKILIKGLPADVVNESVESLIYEIIEILSTPQNVAEELRDKVARTMALSSTRSLTRGVTPQAAKEIVNQTLRGGNLGLSPSGKSIVWRITKADIKKRLG